MTIKKKFAIRINMKTENKTYPSPSNTVNDGKIYQKIGKRYFPVNDIYAYEGLGEGSWLVTVGNGCTSIRKSITPDTAAVEIAFKITEDKLTKIISKYVEAKPSRTPLTPKEKRAMAAYYKVMNGEGLLMFTYPSIQQMSEDILKDVRNSA